MFAGYRKTFAIFECGIQESFSMNWREGYDYPADDEDEGRDFFEEADVQHDKHQDEKLDR